eukprot:9478577-Pyramimonas_sp.AAC.1
MQKLHRLRAAPFQKMALALAPRTFVVKIRKSLRIPMINVPEMVLWKDSGLCGRNSYVDSLC